MKRLLPTLAFALLTALPSGAAAQVHIPMDCRVPNQPPGRCGWCALETIARHQKVTKLYGITDTHPCRCHAEDLERLLIEKKVPYRVQPPGETDTRILRETLASGRGVVVGFESAPLIGAHIVTLVGFDPEKGTAQIIDSSDPERRVRTMPMRRFRYWWDGFALTLEGKRQ
jgi:hypothetical protein